MEDSAMTSEEQAAVSAAFKLGEPLACSPLGGTRNRNYFLKTSTGDFIVRDRYAGYREASRIAFDHHVLALLHRRGVAVVPPLRTSRGETFWQQGDHLWEIFPRATGRHFRDADPEDLRTLA